MLRSIANLFRGRAYGATAKFTLPPVVYEIAPGFLSAAAIEGSMRKGRHIRKVALQSIGPRTLDPHMSHPNISGAVEFGQAAKTIVSAVGNGEGRFGLVLPDGTVRVAVLSFETLPPDAESRDALVRWRMREKLPFNPDEARITYQILSESSGKVEVLAAAVRASIISEYEAVFASSDGGAALILPAAVALLPLLPGHEPGAHVLIHICGSWLTVAVLADSRPSAWRTRELDPGDHVNRNREIAAEAARLLASARDRTQEELRRVWLCARPAEDKALVDVVSSTMEREVSILRPQPEMASTLRGEERSVFEQFGAPLAGLVANAG